MKPLAIVGLPVLCGQACAQSVTLPPISPERPTFSDGNEIVSLGHVQLEGGFTYANTSGAEFTSIGELMLRFPVSQRFEVRLFNFSLGRAFGDAAHVDGPLDSAVGVKYRFQNGNERRPDLAFVLLSTVPTGDSDFRTDRWQPTAKLVLYQQLTSSVGAGGNLVFSSLGRGASSLNQSAISGYVSNSFNAKTSGWFEVYGVFPIFKHGPNAGFADTGLTYLLDNSTAVDFRIGTGFNLTRDGWFLGAGLSHRF